MPWDARGIPGWFRANGEGAAGLLRGLWRPGAEADAACFGSYGRIISTMNLKNAVFFAFIGMALLTILLAVGFIRDFSALLAGAIAAMALLISLIHLLASLSVAVFFYVFYKSQS